ncbi:zinc-dependent alcohol dehydrogenase [Jiangella alkaliphila]|uniref:2-desacetyl-2-hydroxyethyl bacteriochlorophyllide A dehydrogenase n=1 Tax=Jiangella alkaliphila TaxID=419479 RepID=A0A1H2I8M1_9ACTN|nr:zinc-binding alcohol dehydrogenase [Jiangella alkaliphila]SDU40482.1 2-desacetyl-2-hydroxyethyl bacteriochlorophyllide A dehydrogenase [Jiangella alkaliphila]
MPLVVQFTGPRQVGVADEAASPLGAGQVRIATWYSGISAGTELTAYRGSNPYLTKTWDPATRLFTDGAPSFSYPVSGWGYQEVGQVTEVAPDVTSPRAGDVVYGIWGHRAETVVPAVIAARRLLPAGVDPVHGVFARVGAIALNAVLAADVHLGEHVAVFGQGVIGLLATRLAGLNGASVTAVDGLADRVALASRFGAVYAVPVDVPGGAAVAVRSATGGAGADTAIELSGSYHALHEAIRSVRPAGRVVAAGFYQGEAGGLRLGEEFHHNRVEIVASQISGTPRALGDRWNHDRLLTVVMSLVASGQVDVAPLVSHVVPVTEVAGAFELLDQRPAEALQVVLRFPAAPAG